MEDFARVEPVQEGKGPLLTAHRIRLREDGSETLEQAKNFIEKVQEIIVEGEPVDKIDLAGFIGEIVIEMPKDNAGHYLLLEKSEHGQLDFGGIVKRSAPSKRDRGGVKYFVAVEIEKWKGAENLTIRTVSVGDAGSLRLDRASDVPDVFKVNDRGLALHVRNPVTGADLQVIGATRMWYRPSLKSGD